MGYRYDDDILIHLRDRHTGANNAIPCAKVEGIFDINGVTLRQAVNRLRCDAQPVCSNADGYFYAENSDEINDTVTRLLGRSKKMTDAAQGLVLSHQIFYDGRDGL